MENNVYIITKSKIEKKFKKIKCNTFVVKIEGDKIQNERDLYCEMVEKFNLPNNVVEENGINYDVYNDWMTDLTWMNSDESILLIVNNYYKLLDSNKTSRDFFTKRLVNHILPFWEEEVVHTVVGGKRRNFNVYLVVDDDE
ncbi:hypothetical protein OKW23_000492 [Bacilli bacterium PM5-9]|nr:hypothetical protein [Bacilli bacterium PM5-9]